MRATTGQTIHPLKDIAFRIGICKDELIAKNLDCSIHKICKRRNRF